MYGIRNANYSRSESNHSLCTGMTNERKWRIPCAGPGATGMPAAHLGATKKQMKKKP